MLPEPTAPGQMLISKMGWDETTGDAKPQFSLLDVDAMPRPVRNFRHYSDVATKWQKTVPDPVTGEYPSDLVAFISFDDGSLVPEVGDFTLTNTGTTVVGGFFGDAQGARQGGSVQSATGLRTGQRITPVGARSLRFKLLTQRGISTTNYFIYTDVPWHDAIGMRVMISATNGTVDYILNTNGASNNNVRITSTMSVDDGIWHDIICTWDGTINTNGIKLYIDGLLDGQATSLAQQVAPSFSPTTIFNRTDENNNFFTGTGQNHTAPVIVDDIEIYNTVKTPTDFATEVVTGTRFSWRNPHRTIVPQSTVVVNGEADYPENIGDGNIVTETTGQSVFVEGSTVPGKWLKTIPPYHPALVAKISFDDGSLVPEVGNFTLTNTGTTIVDGYWGDAQGARQGAVGANGLMANQRIIPMGTKSIRVKVKISNNISGIYTVLSEISNSSTDHCVVIRVIHGRVDFFLSRGVSAQLGHAIEVRGNIILMPDKWYDILLTWDGTTSTNGVIIWVDGIMDTMGTARFLQTVTPTFNTALLNFSPLNNTLGSPLIIDDVEIYNEVMTPDMFPREEATLTPYFSAFARNAMATGDGVPSNLPSSLIPPEGVPVTGFIAGLGDVELGFKPKILQLSGLGLTQSNTNTTQQPGYVIVDGDTGVNFFAHFNGVAAANAVTVQLTDTGFTITTKGASTPVQIHYVAYSSGGGYI